MKLWCFSINLACASTNNHRGARERAIKIVRQINVLANQYGVTGETLNSQWAVNLEASKACSRSLLHPTGSLQLQIACGTARMALLTLQNHARVSAHAAVRGFPARSFQAHALVVAVTAQALTGPGMICPRMLPPGCSVVCTLTYAMSVATYLHQRRAQSTAQHLHLTFHRSAVSGIAELQEAWHE